LPGATDTAAVPEFGFDQANLPMRLMPPERVAAEGLAALSANRATHIAGRMNRIVAAITPRSVVSSMFGNLMRQAVAKRSLTTDAQAG
jgi:short-subunit dehydrogenase